jgi:hypothetical protein
MRFRHVVGIQCNACPLADGLKLPVSRAGYARLQKLLEEKSGRQHGSQFGEPTKLRLKQKAPLVQKAKTKT